MKRVLFIDRDGTMISEPADEQIDSFAKLEFYPRALYYLAKIAEETDYALVMVTNQDGLGTEVHPEENFRPVHDFVMNTFANEGVVFSDVFIDKTLPKDGALTRKPGTGMLTKYLGEGYDLKNSFVIGDRLNDVKLARNLGTKAIWLNNHTNLGAAEFTENEALENAIALETTQWKDIYEFLTAKKRVSEHRRSTKETDILVKINLDGTGKANISTGLSFFDHMLEQIARHGNIDLTVEARGDLHIDEHHTMEDTAITLGEAFTKALGDKKGIERYSFSLPMDDCLAQVALDLGGRSWLVWEAEFKREKVGDVPTEMFLHFFKSFSDAARCNLNIKAEGQNEHHKIEAIFKAFAKCLRDAVKITGDQLPSTKGVL